MRLKELAELQEKYSHLERTKMTKKSLCDLIIPFRDKYALTDGQALRVARREFTLNQIEKLMKVCSINTASVVDVVEVVHGQWLKTCIPDIYHCTNCKRATKMDELCDSEILRAYCPNCGAKMDGERSTDGNL